MCFIRLQSTYGQTSMGGERAHTATGSISIPSGDASMSKTVSSDSVNSLASSGDFTTTASSAHTTPTRSANSSFASVITDNGDTALEESYAHYTPTHKFQCKYLRCNKLNLHFKKLASMVGYNPVIFIGDAVHYSDAFAEAYERSRAICEAEYQAADKKDRVGITENNQRFWSSREAFMADDNFAKVTFFAYHPSGAVVSLQERKVQYYCGHPGETLTETEMRALAAKVPYFLDLLVHTSPKPTDPIYIFSDGATFETLVWLIVNSVEGDASPFGPKPLPRWVDHIDFADYRQMVRVARSYGMEFALDEVKFHWMHVDPARARAMKNAEAHGWDEDDMHDQAERGGAKLAMYFFSAIFALSGGTMGEWMKDWHAPRKAKSDLSPYIY